MRGRVEAVSLAVIGGLGVWVVFEPLLRSGPEAAGRPWFLGTGVALVLLVLLNLARRAAPAPAVLRLCLAGNAVAVAAGLTVALATHEPRAWAGLAAVTVLTVVSMPSPDVLMGRVHG